jgi:hypothetical protein
MADLSLNVSEVSISGATLLATPLLNKGTAFSMAERRAFGLEGLLPSTLETIDQQCERAYGAFRACADNLEKYIYLRALQDDNEINQVSILPSLIVLPKANSTLSMFITC